MTVSSTHVFGLINIIGGIAVLGSYVYGILAFPELRQSLWGGIDGRWRIIFTLSMLPAAIGYLIFAHSTLFRGGVLELQNSMLLIRILPHIFTVLFLFSSSIWMPATLSYLSTGNIAWWHAATTALWVTACSLIALLSLTTLLYVAEPSRQTLVGLFGLTYITFHCLVLDAVIWITRFPRLE